MKKIASLTIGLVMAAMMGASPAAAMEKGASVGTATVGGTYYIWCGPFVKMVQDNIPGFTMNVEVTGGPVHNIKLIGGRQIDFGTVSMPAVEDGKNGTGWAKGRKYVNMRTLFPMYPSYATFYAKASSGMKNIRDLDGKVFAPGPKGGTPDTYYREMFKMLNINPRKIVNAAMNDIPSQIVDGMIDAGAGSGGEPFAPAVELDSTHPVKILDISNADMRKFIAKYPSWYIGTRKPGGYKLQTKPQPTVMYWNLFVCNDQVSDELAYKIVDVFFGNLKGFEKVYRETMDTVPADVLKTIIPIHPGAAKWYKEHGVKVPASLIGR